MGFPILRVYILTPDNSRESLENVFQTFSTAYIHVGVDSLFQTFSRSQFLTRLYRFRPWNRTDYVRGDKLAAVCKDNHLNQDNCPSLPAW